MTTHNARNERIKRQYFAFLREAKRQSEDSVDAVAKALARFENRSSSSMWTCRQAACTKTPAK